MKQMMYAIVTIVPLLCFAGIHYPMAGRLEDRTEAKEITYDTIRDYQVEILQSVIPFCRMVEWDEGYTSNLVDPYRNWATFSIFSKFDGVKPLVGMIDFVSFKAPLPSSFPASTFEGMLKVFLTTPYPNLEEEVELEECKVIQKTDNSSVLTYTFFAGGQYNVIVRKFVYTGDWFHTLDLRYIGLDDEDVIEFNLKELPGVSNWFQKLEL